MANIGQELATALVGVPASDLRAEIGGIAGMFEVTKCLVSGTGPWDKNFVLPALQCCLATGATVMGQTLQSLIDQSSHIPCARAWE